MFIYFLFLFIVGLVVGSFLNVVIVRLPHMLDRRWRRDCAEYLGHSVEVSTEAFNLAVPRSHCPTCKKNLKIRHNIPVLSFWFLGGRCAFCREKISLQYPFIELLTGLLFCLVGCYYPFSEMLLVVLFYTVVLIVLAGIDFKTLLLPDDLTMSLLWVGLLVNTQQAFVSLQEAVWGAIAGYVFLWLVAFLFKTIRKKEGLGHGDFKLLAALGAWVGLQSVFLVLFLAVILSLLTTVVLLICRRVSFQQQIPFGPFLAMAGWVMLIWQAPLWQLAQHWLGGV